MGQPMGEGVRGRSPRGRALGASLAGTIECAFSLSPESTV